ncbi:uncharacterized protein V1518DRAFT_408664 [Limtongia smithiae]|uniref:uncharacterized protein n=1 Tax=Limtongia smithiae TaxID=1125753 RepID=UPI0034CDDE17
MAQFTDLPVEILQAIAVHLRLCDLPAFARTCRATNATLQSDELWQIRIRSEFFKEGMAHGKTAVARMRDASYVADDEEAYMDGSDGVKVELTDFGDFDQHWRAAYMLMHGTWSSKITPQDKTWRIGFNLVARPEIYSGAMVSQYWVHIYRQIRLPPGKYNLVFKIGTTTRESLGDIVCYVATQHYATFPSSQDSDEAQQQRQNSEDDAAINYLAAQLSGTVSPTSSEKQTSSRSSSPQKPQKVYQTVCNCLLPPNILNAAYDPIFEEWRRRHINNQISGIRSPPQPPMAELPSGTRVSFGVVEVPTCEAIPNAEWGHVKVAIKLEKGFNPDFQFHSVSFEPVDSSTPVSDLCDGACTLCAQTNEKEERLMQSMQALVLGKPSTTLRGKKQQESTMPKRYVDRMTFALQTAADGGNSADRCCNTLATTISHSTCVQVGHTTR